MTAVILYSDPHIGLVRSANTTFKSRARLSQRILYETEKILTTHKADAYFCAGDMFDKFSNAEEVLVQGHHLVGMTDVVLAGNHDLKNNQRSMSSLQMLATITANKGRILLPDWGRVTVKSRVVGNALFVFVPHHPTQELFLSALSEAERVAGDYQGHRELVLHCNYDKDVEDGRDAVLSLPESRAISLLSSFDHIFLGHEHNPRELLDNRVIVIGNPFPTGFGDIGDKRAIRYDTSSGEVTQIPLHKSEELCWSGNASHFQKGQEYAFIDLIDDLPSGHAAKLVSDLFELDSTLAVRLRAPEREWNFGEDLKGEEQSSASLMDVIDSHLKSDLPHLYPCWQEVLKKIGEES